METKNINNTSVQNGANNSNEKGKGFFHYLGLLIGFVLFLVLLSYVLDIIMG